MAIPIASYIGKHVAELANGSTYRLLIISTNLDGFILANHGRFAKLSRYMYTAGIFSNFTHAQ